METILKVFLLCVGSIFGISIIVYFLLKGNKIKNTPIVEEEPKTKI